MNNLSSIKMIIPRGHLTQVKSFVLVRENTGSEMNTSDGKLGNYCRTSYKPKLYQGFTFMAAED